MKTIQLFVLSALLALSTVAQAHDYTRAEIDCAFQATRKTFAEPTEQFLGLEHHFLHTSHAQVKIAMRVETDETSALVDVGTVLATLGGQPLTLKSAGVTTPMYTLPELGGREFWQADAKDVPSLDIVFTDAQIRWILETLNKGSLDLPAGDLGVTIPQFALAHANDYNGVAYYRDMLDTLDFADGVRKDGLSYYLDLFCQIKTLNGERSGD